MRRSDEGTTTAIGVSAGADTIASDLLLRTLRRAAGTRDGGGGGGLEGPQRPPRHHRHAPAAPNREPTDPLAMATAAAVDAALGSGGYAAAWEAGPAAAQSTTPAATPAAATAATAAATTSGTGSNRRRVAAPFEAVRGEATAAAAVEVGLLDVVELLLSVGPFDLVAAVAATVAGAHTVRVARAAAASSGRGRLKDTAAAAAAAASHAFADSSPALVPRQLAAVTPPAARLVEALACDAPAATAGAEAEAATSAGAEAEAATSAGAEAEAATSAGAEADDSRPAAPYGLQNVCRRVGAWGWADALVYGTARV
jgi:hypothetical protein